MLNNENLFLKDSSDLLFHYLILLQEKGFKLEDGIKNSEAPIKIINTKK